MLLLLALHALTGLLAAAPGRWLGRRALTLCLLPPAVTLAWLVVQLPGVLDGDPVHERTSWVPALGVHIDLRLDGFAALMVAVVSGVGLLVVHYARSYFSAEAHDLGRLAGLLTVFAGAMLGVVLADDLFVLYTCWELTSISSYLLIGHHHTEAKARAAALHALLVTGAGGLAMLAGFVVLSQEAGTTRLSGLLDAPPSGTAASVGLVLVLLGVATKSAQYPFHGWLPGAMAAPTPVSAYLHAATMVKAGIVLLARLAPAFAVLGFWRPLVTTVGVVTLVAGALRALRQQDLKLLLAFGTVSQLGLLVVLFGLGTPEATAAGCVMLLAHACYKAALFLVVGVVDRRTGTRDRRVIPTLGPGWTGVKVATLVSAASMAGVPLLAGFIGKEAAYDALLEHGGADGVLVLAGLVLGSALTVAYAWRFAQPILRSQEAPAAVAGATRPARPGLLAAPIGPLVVVTLLVGLVPGLLGRWVTMATRALNGTGDDVHLALWHGFGTPLLLSGVTLALGALVAVARRPLDPVLAAGGRIPSGADAYLGLLRLLNRTANRVTAIVQNGSLPVYAGVVLLTAAVLPTATLLTGDGWDAWPRAVDTPAHLPVAVVLVGSALAAATIRWRLSAVLFLGVTGYAMAALFVVQGAPDLALTQVAIETLSTVLFVLVLRHLPNRFEPRSTSTRRVIRFLVAATVAASVFAFALYAGQTGAGSPTSDEMVERALPDGHGRNVVNVILVDFRGLDTMGEITVLATAAIGMVALARAGRRPRGLPPEPPVTAEAEA